MRKSKRLIEKLTTDEAVSADESKVVEPVVDPPIKKLVRKQKPKV